MLATGFYTALLGCFAILTLLLYQSGLQSEAKVLPYITAAIALPLLGFKTLRAASPRVQNNLQKLKQRFGLDEEHELAEPLVRAEFVTLGWLVMFVFTAYVFGLVFGIFVSVFAFIAHQEGEYLKAAAIALMISAVIYLSLPILFNKFLWPGLLASL